MLPRLTLLVCLTLLGASSARAAQQAPLSDASPIAAAVERAAKTGVELDPWAVSPVEKRPATLLALYGTYGAMQVMDVVTTRRAVASGAQESNRLMGAGGTGRLIAIKAATGASTIFFSERLWKKNKAGAIVVMAALNGVSAAIVARNMRNASGRTPR